MGNQILGKIFILSLYILTRVTNVTHLIIMNIIFGPLTVASLMALLQPENNNERNFSQIL